MNRSEIPRVSAHQYPERALFYRQDLAEDLKRRGGKVKVKKAKKVHIKSMNNKVHINNIINLSRNSKRKSGSSKPKSNLSFNSVNGQYPSPFSRVSGESGGYIMNRERIAGPDVHLASPLPLKFATANPLSQKALSKQSSGIGAGGIRRKREDFIRTVENRYNIEPIKNTLKFTEPSAFRGACGMVPEDVQSANARETGEIDRFADSIIHEAKHEQSHFHIPPFKPTGAPDNIPAPNLHAKVDLIPRSHFLSASGDRPADVVSVIEQEKRLKNRLKQNIERMERDRLKRLESPHPPIRSVEELSGPINFKMPSEKAIDRFIDEDKKYREENNDEFRQRMMDEDAKKRGGRISKSGVF